MTLRQRLATWLFGKEIQRRIQQAVSERDELWARTVHDTFYREGGNPVVGMTVAEWNPIRLPHSLLFEPDWGIVWRVGIGESYNCPVRVVSEAELSIVALDVFRPEENKENKENLS